VRPVLDYSALTCASGFPQGEAKKPEKPAAVCKASSTCPTPGVTR